MANTTLTPSAGALGLTGYTPVSTTLLPGTTGLTLTTYAPVIFPQGQQREPLEATRRVGADAPASGAVGVMTFAKSISTVELALRCLTGLGFVPGGVTVIGFVVKSTDLDTGTPALVQSLYVGDSELVTGITAAQGGTYGIYACVPTLTTAPTAVYVKTTTAAATAAAGTMYVTVFYYS